MPSAAFAIAAIAYIESPETRANASRYSLYAASNTLFFMLFLRKASSCEWEVRRKDEGSKKTRNVSG